MFNPLRALMVAGVCLCLAFTGAAPAFADPQRSPATGAPAFTYDRPDGWQIQLDGGATVTAPSKECFVMMHMVEDDGFAGQSTDQVAAVMLDMIKAEPFSRSEPHPLGAAAASAYYSRIVSEDGEMRLVLILVRLNGSTVAAVLAATTPTAPAREREDYNRLIGSIRLQSTEAPRSL